jgi:hypothetical protein
MRGLRGEAGDGKIEGREGYADWVDEWSDGYDVMPRVDACLLGAGMYPGYEGYWTALQNEPDKPLPMTGKVPTPAELEWATEVLIPAINLRTSPPSL